MPCGLLHYCDIAMHLTPDIDLMSKVKYRRIFMERASLSLKVLSETQPMFDTCL